MYQLKQKKFKYCLNLFFGIYMYTCICRAKHQKLHLFKFKFYMSVNIIFKYFLFNIT